MKTRIPLVIDTDAFNEIDDQFAIVYALCCPETFDVMAILAAPFFNEKSSCDVIARRYTEGYLRNKEMIEAALKLFDQEYPESFEEGRKLAERIGLRYD